MRMTAVSPAPNRKWMADHLRVDRGRLALCRFRDRPALAARGRLVDERSDDGAAGH